MNRVSIIESGNDCVNNIGTSLSDIQDSDSEEDSDDNKDGHKLEKNNRVMNKVSGTSSPLGRDTRQSTRQRRRVTRNSGPASDQEDVAVYEIKPLSLESMFVGTLSTNSHHSNQPFGTRKEVLQSGRRVVSFF